jgi:hypothetical protein
MTTSAFVLESARTSDIPLKMRIETTRVFMNPCPGFGIQARLPHAFQIKLHARQRLLDENAPVGRRGIIPIRYDHRDRTWDGS